MQRARRQAHYDRIGSAVREGRGPREQILEEGAERLSDRELLAALLGSGCAGTPVVDLAGLLLNDGSIESLARKTPRELSRTRGLGTARACQLLAAFEIGRRTFGRASALERPIRTPQDLLPLVQHYAAAPKEHFLAVLLNTRHLPISVELISVGSLAASIVHPREVFRPAIIAAAASVILVHNHPSGDTTPSEDDLEITQRLCRVGEMTGIEVLDHVILGSGARRDAVAAGGNGRCGTPGGNGGPGRNGSGGNGAVAGQGLVSGNGGTAGGPGPAFSFREAGLL